MEANQAEYVYLGERLRWKEGKPVGMHYVWQNLETEELWRFDKDVLHAGVGNVYLWTFANEERTRVWTSGEHRILGDGCHVSLKQRGLL